MTIVNVETGEIVERLGRDEAERLSNRIALRLDSIADNYEAVVPMIRESVEREAWSALGYRSPGEYAADRFGGALSRLGVEFRQAVTRELAEMGMSTRAIAGVVGVSKDTVHRDLGGVSRETPGPTTGIDGKTYSRPEPRPETSEMPSPKGREESTFSEPFRPAESAEPELADLDDAGPNVQPEAGSQPPTPSPRTVGMDGKSYPKPPPRASRRKPLPDFARDAGWDLRKSVERLQRLAADDRFAANKAQMAPHLRGHLTNAIEVCQDLLDRINN